MNIKNQIKMTRWIEANRTEISTGGKTVKQLSEWACKSLGIKVPSHALTQACQELGVKYRRVSQTTSEKLRLQSDLGEACRDRDEYREALLSCINSGAAQSWLLKKIAEDFPQDQDLAKAIAQKLEPVAS